MPSGVARFRRVDARPFSLVLVVLALVSQLAIGAMVVPDAAPRAQGDTLAALSIVCGTHAAGRHPPASRHRAPQAAVCPLSVALALPGVILVAAGLLPRSPSAAMVQPVWHPQARGPPAALLRVGTPRGPPILV